MCILGLKGLIKQCNTLEPVEFSARQALILNAHFVMYFLEFFKFTIILTITPSHIVQIAAIMSWFKHVTMSQFCHTPIFFNSKTDDSNL